MCVCVCVFVCVEHVHDTASTDKLPVAACRLRASAKRGVSLDATVSRIRTEPGGVETVIHRGTRSCWR